MKFDTSLPRDRATINELCRYTVATQPIVCEAIELHSTLINSFIKICLPENKTVSSLFQNQINDLGLDNILSQIIKDYNTLGECFIFAELNEEKLVWSNIILQNPDYVSIKKDLLGTQKISLRPDPKLRSLVLKKQHSEEDLVVLAKLDKKIINSIKNGNNIELNDFNISAILRKQNNYDVRGTSILLPVLDMISMLNENLSMQFSDLGKIQELQKQIKNTIYHPDCIKSDTIRKQMFVSNMSEIAHKYINWLRYKIFAPISKLNDLYEYKDAAKTLIVPNVIFDVENFTKSLS